MDLIKDTIIQFDNIITKLYLERYHFESEEKQNKSINKLKETIEKNIDSIKNEKANKILKKIRDFSFNEEISKIIQTINQLIEFIERASGNIYGELDEITPFPLSDKKSQRETKTYNEAINTLNPFEIISPYEKKIKGLQSRVRQQEEAIKKQEKKIELNKQKGETIYEKYTPLQKLLDIVKELRANDKEWEEIAQELKQEKKIKGVDLKNKRVVIDL